MARAIVLGGGSDQINFLEQLKMRNISTVLVDYYSNPPAKSHADIHYIVSTLDQEAVLNIAREEKVDFVFTACIDQAILTASYVSEKLGLSWPFSYDQAFNVTNKASMKAKFFSSGVPTANFISTSAPLVALHHQLTYPVVVKPADCNGSLGVKRVISDSDFNQAVMEAFHNSRSNTIVVEEYIDGIELSVDAFVNNGVVSILLITETRKIPFSESVFSIYQSRFPVSLQDDILGKIYNAVKIIVSAFELDNTPLLVQFIIKDSEAYVVEFGARIAGGSKQHLIKHITGIDVISAYIKTLFQEPNQFHATSCNKLVAIEYIYSHAGVYSQIQGVESLKQDKTVVEFFIYKTPGMELSGRKASRDRVGAFITEGNTISELENKLERARRKIKVLDESGSNKTFYISNIFKIPQST